MDENQLDECGCSHVRAQHPSGVCTASNPREDESSFLGLCYCNEFEVGRDDSFRWQTFIAVNPDESN